jgi:hypothetical protein
MVEFVKKYFIPGDSNDYVPHFFRKAAVGILLFSSLLIFFGGLVHIAVINKTDLLSAVIPRVIVGLTNENRQTSQLSELSINPVLEVAAQRKADHMARLSYFAHTSPDGVTPWYWFKDAGYEYLYAGENLAVNFIDSEDVDKAWMNSPTHRSNILNGKFTEIGVATARGTYKGRETVFVVQLFGRPLPSFAKKIIGSGATANPVATSASSTPTTTSATKPNSQIINNPPPKQVLGESESFVSVTNLEVDVEIENRALSEEPVLSEKISSPSETETLLTSPKKTVSTLYFSLASLIVLALILLIFVEIRKQSPKHIAIGVILLVLVFALLYVFREYLYAPLMIV